jgi:hypothetical protein
MADQNHYQFTQGLKVDNAASFCVIVNIPPDDYFCQTLPSRQKLRS